MHGSFIVETIAILTGKQFLGLSMVNAALSFIYIEATLGLLLRSSFIKVWVFPSKSFQTNLSFYVNSGSFSVHDLTMFVATSLYLPGVPIHIFTSTSPYISLLIFVHASMASSEILNPATMISFYEIYSSSYCQPCRSCRAACLCQVCLYANHIYCYLLYKEN